jgi:hypothetical protein
MKNLIIYYFLFNYFLIPIKAQTPMENKTIPCNIIYKIDVNVKSKRPDKNGLPLWKYALLDICRPTDEKETPQRMAIEVEWEGKKYYKELISIMKVFKTEKEAIKYAIANKVPIANSKDSRSNVSYITKDDAVNSKPKTYTGIAQNAKAGACLIDDKGITYFIEGLDAWKDNVLKKQVKVKGILIIKKQTEELKNEKGEYSAGSEGDIYIIINPKY